MSAWILIWLLAQAGQVGAPNAVGGQSPAALKQAYEEALDRARESRQAGRAEEADQRYLEAWQRARQAYQGEGFGTRTMLIPVGDIDRGDFRQEEVEIPAGEDIPVGVAEEAARAADELGRPQGVLTWLPRLSILYGTESAPGPDELSQEASSLIEELAAQAEKDGRKEAAAIYRGRLDQVQAKQEAEWAAEAAENERSRWLGLGILAACLLPVWFFEVRSVWRSRKDRRLMGLEQFNDGAVIHSAEVVARDEQDRPRVFATSAGDVVGRVVTSFMLSAMALGAVAGGVVFLDLAWDRPGDSSTWLILGLVWLFFAFAGFMGMTSLANPSSSVRRLVELGLEALVVRSRTGLVFTHVWTEVFPWAKVRGARIQQHEQQVKHARIITNLIVVDVGDRSIVLGGKPERRWEQAEEIVQAIQAHLQGGKDGPSRSDLAELMDL